MKDNKGILIVISGFSGAGKGTLVRELLRRHGQDYVLSVSMTTRAPRPGERDGVEYFFTDRERFEEAIEQDGLVEYASYCGNYYGTPRAYVEEKLAEGKNVILEIEIQGALKESREVIASRLARAAEESEGVELYDYLVVNDKLEESAEEIHHLVAAARRAPVRREAFVKGIREELHSFAKGAQE